MKAIDLFSGAGGWCIAANRLGIKTTGFELNEHAVATRRAASLTSVKADISAIDSRPADLLIASPPCTAFSKAGARNGKTQSQLIHETLEVMALSGRMPELNLLDATASLILEPMRWILEQHAAGTPYRYVIMEQVPAALEFFESYVAGLRKLGYSAVAANLNSEAYGTPQTRKRAILIASLDEQAQMPRATHHRYNRYDPTLPHPEDDTGLKPWVSMAEVLPHYGEFSVRSQYGGRKKCSREHWQPSATVTSKSRSNVVEFNDGSHTRMSVSELGVFQGFDAEHPWQGGISAQMLQVGNAVPVQFAEAILKQVTPRTRRRRQSAAIIEAALT